MSNKQLQNMTEITDEGQVFRMYLPAIWTEVPLTPLPYEHRYLRRFQCGDDAETIFSFYYRGRPTPAEAGRNFRRILDRPPNALTTRDIESISDTLEIMADPQQFRIDSCRTETLNGKRVLVVEGLWLYESKPTYEIMIDSTGDGDIVQEIYFTASQPDFDRLLKEMRSAFETITWKDTA